MKGRRKKEPIDSLRIRLARGEITKEEYREMIKLLEEYDYYRNLRIFNDIDQKYYYYTIKNNFIKPLNPFFIMENEVQLNITSSFFKFVVYHKNTPLDSFSFIPSFMDLIKCFVLVFYLYMFLCIILYTIKIYDLFKIDWINPHLFFFDVNLILGIIAPIFGLLITIYFQIKDLVPPWHYDTLTTIINLIKQDLLRISIICAIIKLFYNEFNRKVYGK